MSDLQGYLLGVVATAMLNGILIRITKSSGSKDIIRMVCGVFLTIVLIQPFLGRKLQWESVLPDMELRTEEITAEAAATAEDIRRKFIKQRVETYILSRAGTMNVDIQPDVALGEDCVPVSVRIAGSVPPLCRSKLSQIITSELGIPRERQEWIG